MSGASRKTSLLTVAAVAVVGLAGLSFLPEEKAEAKPSGFTLSKNCPAGFVSDDQQLCQFVSLYQGYNSRSGFGGLRAELPEMRGTYSAQQIDLGRILFYDPLLAGDRKTSCAHCHHPDYGFADGRGTSNGFGGDGVGPARAGGTEVRRAAPSLWNTGFLRRLFWDGRAIGLEEQAEGPLFAPEEMGTTPEQLEADLADNADYQQLFRKAFDMETGAPIKVHHVTKALSAFQSSLISFNSRYDRYAHGDHTALSEREINGHNVFRSFVARCSQCHTPPLFTNGEMAVLGSPEPEGRAFDAGAELVFDAPELRGAFKVPTLRNINRTAPYMHSGAFETLEEVIDFYNDKRGHALPEAEEDGKTLFIHWHLADPDLSDSEEKDLIAFLMTLEDETMTPAIPEKVPSGLPVVKRAGAKPIGTTGASSR